MRLEKDIIIEIEDNEKLYILETANLQDRNFAFISLLDNLGDLTNNYGFIEAKECSDGGVHIDSVTDASLLRELVPIFQKLMQEI